MTIKIKTILKKLLHEHDLTAAQLARATKTPPQTINNWLSGLEPRNLNQLRNVADYFEVSVDYLVYGLIDSRFCKRKDNFGKIEEFENEINAGLFEVVLRRVRN